MAGANIRTPLHSGSHKIKEKHMKEKIISEIMREMLPTLNNEQLRKLKNTLEACLLRFLLKKQVIMKTQKK